MAAETMVSVENLTFSYPGVRRGSARRFALREVSFGVFRAEIFGLLGPNGGGKTTLFRILSTLTSPQSGTARIAGFDVGSQAQEVRMRLGVAFQSPSLDKKLTVRENLRHQGHLYGIRGAELETRMMQNLEVVGLADRAQELVEKLSGGMARRTELAKTLLHRPEVLLLDEPSTGLDPAARREFWNHLKKLRSESGATILLTTHLMEEAAGCDRLALIDRGRIVALGTPAQLASEVGGDVLTIHTDEPETLLAEILQRFSCGASLLDGNVRIELPDGHRFIPQLVEAFPGRIRSVNLGKPTLEDVFIHRTGHRLGGADESQTAGDA